MKRILSVILTVLLIVCAIPQSSFAWFSGGGGSSSSHIDQADAITEDGWGYTLDDEENATIVGYAGSETELEIPSFVDAHPVKAIEKHAFDNEPIVSVVIPDGVESVGEFSFANCTSLRSVIIPDSVTDLGGYLFSNSKNISNVHFPSGAKEIPEGTFLNCYNRGITFNVPENLERIGYGAFNGCLQLVDLVLPDSVTEIDDFAFNGCGNLRNLTMSPNIQRIGIRAFFDSYPMIVSSQWTDGCLYIGDYLISTQKLSSGDITVREGTLIIADDCFEWTTIGTLTLPQSLKNISSKAISNCATIVVDENNPYYTSSDDVLYNKDMTQLIKYPRLKQASEFTVPEQVEVIAEEAFKNTSLSKITMGDRVRKILPSAFRYSSISEIELSGSITEIGASSFYQCKNLEKISIPSNIKSIGDSAFMYCSSLSSVDLPENLDSIGTQAFYACSSLKDINFNNGLTEIGEKAFYQCKALESIELPESLEKLGKYSFYWCTALKSASISSNLETIEEFMFYGCTELSSVTVPEELEVIGESAFSGCSKLSQIDLPDTIREYGKECFKGCSLLTYVPLGDNVEYIGERAFQSTSLEDMECIYINNDTMFIGSGAFGWTKIKSVVFGENVTTIDERAFTGCKELESVSLGSNIKKIGNGAFSSCEKIAHIDFPEGLTSIGSSAFSYCKALTEVSLPDGLQTLGSSAFSECDELNTVYLGKNITSIPDYTFFKCNKLEKVFIPDTVTTIGYEAFQECYNLKDFKLPASLTTIGSAAFYKAGGPDLVIPEGVTNIGRYTFGYSTIESITMPESVKTIDEYAFYSSLIKSINLENVETIGEKAFQSARCTTHVTLYKIKTIANNAFSGSSVADLTIDSPELVSIGDYAFSNCSLMKNIYVNGGKNASIGKSAFYSDKIESIYIGNGIEQIGEEYSMGRFAPYTDITISNSVKTIGKNAFAVAYYLKDVWYLGTEAEWNKINIDNTKASSSSAGNDYLLNATKHFYCAGNAHSLTSETTQPTCTENGVTVTSCTKCHYRTEETIPALDHNYNDRICTRCGDVLPMPIEWTYDEESKTITISGDVMMDDYSLTGENTSTSNAPWASCDDAKTLVIEKGVKSVGDFAFYNMPNLETVIFSDDISSIGERAFFNCVELKKVNLENFTAEEVSESENSLDPCLGEITFMSMSASVNATKIGEYAFANCINLSEITIPSGITSIEKGAFEGCSAMSEIVIPESITEISDGTFNGCDALENVWYTGSYESWSSLTDGTSVIPSGASVHFDYCTDAHDFETIVTSATCTENGLVKEVCTRCAYTVSTVTPSLGHSYVDGVCSRCGEAEHVETSIPGDINGDKEVTARDIKLLVQFMVGIVDRSDIIFKNADVDKDGEISSKDRKLILQIIVGVIDGKDLM